MIKKRLDMKKDLYDNIIEYSKENSLGGSTLGSRVLIAVEDMYDKVNKINFDNMVDITDENKKLLSTFQNFGILDTSTLSDAVNEAINIYISEHKEELQKKIAEL